jgi:solute carrier family 39 (zinc transporter), member 1/2/3
MISVFSLFLIELFAMRVAHMQFATTDALGSDSEEDEDKHEHGTAYGPPAALLEEGKLKDDLITGQMSSSSPPSTTHSPKPIKKLDARLVGFFVLEFGVIFHSLIIGLTLSTTGTDFNTLFIVIIFHQMFEGLGLGSRLAILPFPPKSSLPWLLGSAYAIVTPLGMSIGLGLRTTYDSASQTALLVSGILDAISSGILLYTGLVELLAHEFLFSNGASSHGLGC